MTEDRVLISTHDLARAGQLDLSADVLVLPHHGSVRASSREFLKAVGPRLAIRSSGQRAVDTFSELSEILGQTRLLNTADVGAVTVTIDRNGLRVTSVPSGGGCLGVSGRPQSGLAVAPSDGA